MRLRTRTAAEQSAVGSVCAGESTRSDRQDGVVVREVAARAADSSYHEVVIDAGDAGALGADLHDDSGDT